MSFVWSSRVRFVDTDASGRIHFTAMLRHFEAAEIEFMRSLGQTVQDARAAGVTLPRVRVECTFTAMVRFDDLLDLAVIVARVGNSSYQLAFEVTVQDKLVAQGSFTIVAVDNQTQRSRPLPEAFARALRERQALLPRSEQAANQN